MGVLHGFSTGGWTIFLLFQKQDVCSMNISNTHNKTSLHIILVTKVVSSAFICWFCTEHKSDFVQVLEVNLQFHPLVVITLLNQQNTNMLLMMHYELHEFNSVVETWSI